MSVTVFIRYRFDLFKRAQFDSEGVANFNFAQEHKFITAEERTFLRKVVT